MPSAATLRSNQHLSGEQESAIADIISGANVLTTGGAGTGKSTVLNELRKNLGDRLLVTASTGVAAVNVGGNTVHSTFGLGLCRDEPEKIAYQLVERGTSALMNVIRADTVAIDEISMLDARTFGTLNRVFQLIRKNTQPFGGVQIVAFGDFLQLPPIKKRETADYKPLPGEGDFAFESQAWKAAGIRQHEFTKVFRQEERLFAAALRHLRVGHTGDATMEVIKSRIGAVPAKGIRPVRLFCHNVDVDAMNENELAQVAGETHEFEAQEFGKPASLEKLRKDCLAPQNLRVKIGAQVMLLVNLDPELRLVNGSLGTVTGVNPDYIRVHFTDADATLCIERHTWKLADGEKTLAEREQFPLRLAYALTSHKSQGMSLDHVECDLSQAFAFGQAYVALSRARRLEGLYIRSLDLSRIRAHPAAMAFYFPQKKAA